MVAHHRIAPDGDAEDISQQMQAIFNPLPPMLEGLAAKPILAAQERPAHAARNAVESTGRAGRYQDRAGIGHGQHYRLIARSCLSENFSILCRKFLTLGCPVLCSNIDVAPSPINTQSMRFALRRILRGLAPIYKRFKVDDFLGKMDNPVN